MIGDINDDGVSDFASAGTAPMPYVRAFSGANGQPLWTVLAPAINFGFANVITGGGDVDGDGFKDVLVQQQWVNGPGDGATHVLSGVNGSLIRTHFGSGSTYHMAPPGAIFGDADGDGYDDYLIGDSSTSHLGGPARVISGRTGSVLYSLLGGGSSGPNWSTGLGDVDGDGFDDFAASQIWCNGPFGPCAGRIAGFSGRTGTQLYSLLGDDFTHGMSFEGPRSGGGDLNGDGIGDFVTSGYVFGPGLIRAHSGLDGSMLWQRQGTSGNESLIGLLLGDDWNGDGHDDVVAARSSQPSFLILSGTDGSILRADPNGGGVWFTAFGGQPMLADDVNGDGSREMLSMGGTWQTARFNGGGLFITSHAGGPLSYHQEFGRGCPASNGSLPRALLRRDPTLGRVAQIRLRGTVPGASPVLLLGLPLPGRGGVEWTTGCRIYVDPLSIQMLGPTNTHGMTGHDIPIPAVPALAGLQLALQWIVLDPQANPSQLIGSTALRVLLGS